MKRRWKTVAVSIWAAWLVLAYIFAWQRSTCGQPWEAACWKAGWQSFGDAILLTWVKDYQELIAGLAALGGGAAVIIAYWMQRSDAELSARRIAKSEGSTICNLASQRFIDWAVDIAHNAAFGRNFNTDLIVGSFRKISEIDPMLATVTMAAVRDVTTFCSNQGPANSRDRHKMAAECYAMARVLEHVGEHLDEAGRFNFKGTCDIPPTWLSHAIRNLAINSDDLFPYRSFFEWDDQAATPNKSA